MISTRAIGIAVACVALLACGPVALRALNAPAAIVSQQRRLFMPADIAVPAGGTVRFTNDDPFLHQISATSPTFSFDTDGQSPGQSVDIAFPKAGDFRVVCGIHPKMSLMVHVR